MKGIIEAESKLEEKREAIALEKYFTSFEAFRFFDKAGRGYLYSLDFYEGLKTLKVEGVTKQDVWLLWNRYDTDGDGILRFSEFLHMLAPATSEYAKLL